MEPKRTKLGNQLGVVFCLAGFVLIWVGWNGAASYDLATRQFPYLISGGIAGLCLVNIGIGLFMVQSQRAERTHLEQNLAGLTRILETLVEVQGRVPAGHAEDGLVLGGSTAYHRPELPPGPRPPPAAHHDLRDGRRGRPRPLPGVRARDHHPSARLNRRSNVAESSRGF